MNAKTPPDLTLYGFSSCPYCARVQRALDDLGLAVPWRNTLEAEHRSVLVEETGGTQVPALLIDNEGDIENEDKAKMSRWMKESADIVDYLYERFGDGRRAPRSFRLERFATPLLWGLLIVGGVVGGTGQGLLWTLACSLAAVRSVLHGRRARAGAFLHYTIAALFGIAAVSVVADTAFGVSIAWWYLAFGFVLALAVAAVAARVQRGSQVAGGSSPPPTTT
ncbi:MAG: glutathione S-transferase N-terminal domain-containing protein [Myxococcota bacterium]